MTQCKSGAEKVKQALTLCNGQSKCMNVIDENDCGKLKTK